MKDDNFPAGLYKDVGLESYRIEAKETMSLALDDEDKEISPATKTNPPEVSQREKYFLSVIVDELNGEFSNSE